MKITTLIENSLGDNKNLLSEHGISFYIETNNETILFDTGQSGDFIKNAEKLNVDLNKIDYLILSHSHYDHCGGVKKLLEKFNKDFKLYIGNNFFNYSNRYHYTYKDRKTNKLLDEPKLKYIGIDFDREYIENKKIIINNVKEDINKISDEVYIFTNFNKNYNFENLNPNMKVKLEDKYFIDPFCDEIVLGIDSKYGLIILLGCSHVGVLNIVSTILKRTNKDIYAVIGGTHLIEADEKRIEKTIDELEKMNIKYIGLSHCTGKRAINIFKDKSSNFFINGTGTVFKV